MRWQSRKGDQNMERELRSDLDLEEEEQRERECPEEARYAALRAFGNPSLISEQTRAVWSWDWLRYSFRDSEDRPSRTLARTARFSRGDAGDCSWHGGDYLAVHRRLVGFLKPLPFDHPEQLVRLYESSERFPANVVAPGIYGEWKRETRSLSDLALYNDFPQYNALGRRCAARTGPCDLSSWDLFAHARRPAQHRTFLYAGRRSAFRQRYRHPQLVPLEPPLWR